MTAKLDNSPDLVKEAIAYETLMSLEGISETALEKEFPTKSQQLALQEHKPLTKILETMADGDASQEIKALQPVVERYFGGLTDSFSICTQESGCYPARLKDTRTPLRMFYYKGDPNLLEVPCVSIIGSRQASPTACQRAASFTGALVKAGYTIVSGLAKGVDTAALQAATSMDGGQVIAVIGTPINQYYPKENQQLQGKIAKDHLLISHVPFYKYQHQPFKDRRFYFPKRNVTMSALSQATIIIEATGTSGSIHQAEAALRQGRQLFICKEIFEAHSWPNRLVERGAIKLDNIDQLLGVLKKN